MLDKKASIIKFILKYLDEREYLFISRPLGKFEGTLRLKMFEFFQSCLSKLLTVRVFYYILLILQFFSETIAVESAF